MGKGRDWDWDGFGCVLRYWVGWVVCIGGDSLFTKSEDMVMGWPMYVSVSWAPNLFLSLSLSLSLSLPRA